MSLADSIKILADMTRAMTNRTEKEILSTKPHYSERLGWHFHTKPEKKNPQTEKEKVLDMLKISEDKSRIE